MPYSPLNFASGVLSASCCIGCFLICGCEKSDQISVYTVPSHSSLQTPEYVAAEQRRLAERERQRPKAVPTRMIGVIIPKGSQIWFLKLDGDVDAVAAREGDVREFLKTLRFSQSESLEWTLPNGWRELPGSELRHATLALNGEPPLEMSVSKFPSQEGIEIADQVLANINRWRGQVSLRPIEKEDLDSKSEKLALNDCVAYWVNLEGIAAPSRSMKSAPRSPASNQTKPADSSTPKFETPAGWKEAPATSVSRVSLQCVEGEAKIGITVTSAGGNRDMNVNRWREQIKLEPLTREQLDAGVQRVEVGSGSGELYEMMNDDKAILGVIVEDQGQTWFVKLMGDRQLAERERPHFLAFLKSLQLRTGR